MIHRGASGKGNIASPEFASNLNAMTYTDHVITCNSCSSKFEDGWLLEVYGMGLYCSNCLRSAFVAYFKEHPDSDYILARAVWSLAYQKGREK